MPNAPQADSGLICPLHKKDVSKVCHKCPWYTQIRGKNPQTGVSIDEWQCAISWIPILTTEVAQKTNQVGAAVESFRNRMIEQNQLIFQFTEESRKTSGLSLKGEDSKMLEIGNGKCLDSKEELDD